MGADTVKIFCPKCQCVYHPPPIRSRSSNHGAAGAAAGVDGAAFGTTFPHLFLMTFSNLVPDRLPPDSAYVPRVFGFRVHVSARQRTTGTSAGLAAAAVAAATPSTRTTNGITSSSRRSNFTRRTSTTKIDITTQDATVNAATADAAVPEAENQNSAKSTKADDDGNKSKSNNTKRRSDDDGSNSKRRRKGE
jgi:hypothetical protein